MLHRPLAVRCIDGHRRVCTTGGNPPVVQKECIERYRFVASQRSHTLHHLFRAISLIHGNVVAGSTEVNISIQLVGGLHKRLQATL